MLSPLQQPRQRPLEYGMTQRGLLDFFLSLSLLDPAHMYDMLHRLGLVMDASSHDADGSDTAALTALLGPLRTVLDTGKLASVELPLSVTQGAVVSDCTVCGSVCRVQRTHQW